MTTLVRTRAELDAALASPPRGRRAVVMTMGALHSGHTSLVHAARDLVGPHGQVVVTVFVNPLQFGPNEDFAQYPRDLEADLATLAASGAAVDLVLAPDVAEVYPGYPDAPLVRVSAGRLGEVLEGASRPGHFDGVLTVVLKLLHLVQPDVAVFGEKDAQQLLLIRRMVTDLDVPVEVVGVPIARADDGVALSSRNAYLSAAERESARALSGALRAGAAAGALGAEAVRAAAQEVLAEACLTPDYLRLVDPTTVDEVPSDHGGPALLLVAARVGTTRLIDNMAVQVTDPGETTR
ncbi:pantothenate synthetase [Flavimobilis marinus]|uniref:Pantothenate synthetase n=1 Tax=Flavimobilis marinus TaxID=285351 RepID=A0A1I2GX29_9MICO|nr:pantoate--beta-alanine ligase [Flavimobilis marinus]GHG55237.1 pantothenate synthetase [Flavimobilis marinus]SFF21121.1 pantoate--beta-alanine ligase [Flavimobilis marinus]